MLGGERGMRRIPREYWFLIAWLAIVALGWLGRRLHFMDWVGSLPFAYQVLADCAFVLVPTVGMFLVWLAVLRMGDASQRP